MLTVTKYDFLQGNEMLVTSNKGMIVGSRIKRAGIVGDNLDARATWNQLHDPKTGWIKRFGKGNPQVINQTAWPQANVVKPARYSDHLD